MEKKIVTLVNRHHDLIHNPKTKILLKIELGKSPIPNLLSTFRVVPEFRDYLKSNGKLKTEREYYQYQFQNQYLRRIKSHKLETEIITDNFIDSSTHKDNGVDFRFSLHQIKTENVFSQHLAFHNIVYVKEEIWDIKSFQIVVKKEKKYNFEVETFYFLLNVPFGTGQLDEISKISEDIYQIFKSIIDSKARSRTLDSILES